eukprot:TRINITY_DN54939_c0_g1_i2.p1 TRINITY_DN54939_c0_g1~~TRINITY_DN54939_c0_g1_i2.p1  ORF type:complete len:505 (+),score=68.11 TRINITY_DN54939_c0_g1_i2:194-1708(+)
MTARFATTSVVSCDFVDPPPFPTSATSVVPVTSDDSEVRSSRCMSRNENWIDVEAGNSVNKTRNWLSLDEEFLGFDDLTVHADAAMYGSMPITAGLRLTRWQALLHGLGWLGLLYTVTSTMGYVSGEVTSWRTCSAFLSGFTRFSLVWISSTGSSVLHLVLPLLLRRRLVRPQTACRVYGSMMIGCSFPAALITMHLFYILLGIEENEGHCSDKFLLAHTFRFSTGLFCVHTAYVFLCNEGAWLWTVWGWCLLNLMANGVDIYLNVIDMQTQCFSLGMAVPTLVWLVIFSCRRRRRVQQAKMAIKVDQDAYNAAWHRVSSQEQAAVLNETAADIKIKLPPCDDLRQAVKNLDQLYADAVSVEEAFADMMNMVASLSGGRFVAAPLKKTSRSFQKLRRAYADDCSKLCDVVRGSIVYDSLEGIQKGLEVLREETTIRRLKNRFDPSYDATLTGGYRDLCLNVDMDCGKCRAPHTCEIQLHHVKLFGLKSHGGHTRYIEFRDLCGR